MWKTVCNLMVPVTTVVRRGTWRRIATRKKRDNGKGNGKSGTGGRFRRLTGTCRCCHKKGHKKAQCWEKFPDKKPEKFKKASEQVNEVSELFCGSVATHENKTVKQNSWIGYTGATGH